MAYAALWVRAQGEANPVLLVSEHDDAFDTEWKQETICGPNAWQKKLKGHRVSLPTSWGFPGAPNAKGLTRLKITR